MAEVTRKRKADHIRICLDEKAQTGKTTTGFDDIHFIHKALPEVDRKKIDLSTFLFGHKFNAPLMVGAMTGGTPEAEEINAAIAESVEKLGLGMGVGSQRAAIEDQKLAHTFSVARKKAPTTFLIANIGGVQLSNGYGLREVKEAIDMIGADAVAIHLNALQEAVQPEGQTNFEGILVRIAEIAGKLDKPVIVKETGSGIAREEARKLEAAGVKAIDVGGAGGTSFAAVEHHRAIGEGSKVRQPREDVFWNWGIPTALSLMEVCQTTKISVMASGGIRNGVDVAKTLALGACLASVAQPVLRAAVEGPKETEKLLSCLIEELRNAMFLVGAQKISDLSEVPVVITGKTAEWLRTRGLDVDGYARRGAR